LFGFWEGGVVSGVRLARIIQDFQFGTPDAESCRRSVSPQVASDGSNPFDNPRARLANRDTFAGSDFSPIHEDAR